MTGFRFRQSLRARLTAIIAGLLLANSIFLLAFFPPRMASFSIRWTERRAVGMAVILQGAAAPGLEFDDARNINELLAGVGRAPEVLYAAVRRADGTILGAWQPDLVPPVKSAASLEPAPRVTFETDRLTVDAPILGKGGTLGSLSIGFSLHELERDRRANLYTVGIVSLILFAIGLAAAFTIGTAFARPIRQMTDVANRIAAGDLSRSEVTVDRTDEVGEMASALGRMVEEQRSVVQQIASTSAQLGRAAVEIFDAAQQQEAGATQQSDGMKAASGTVQSLLDSAADIADSARGVLENAERTMETTEISSRRIAELSTHAERIAELLEVIRDIADRSDLLALNASLEATRAGESGRGFTLVAGEMRRLAERVTASVLDVKNLLSDVRRSGASSVQAIEEGRALAVSTTDSARQITQVTQTQRSATAQVSGSMNQIAQVLATSLQTSGRTRSLAERLTQQSAQLERAIGRFRFDRDDGGVSSEPDGPSSQSMRGLAGRQRLRVGTRPSRGGTGEGA